jgi:hypothetical protein
MEAYHVPGVNALNNQFVIEILPIVWTTSSVAGPDNILFTSEISY